MVHQVLLLQDHIVIGELNVNVQWPVVLIPLIDLLGEQDVQLELVFDLQVELLKALGQLLQSSHPAYEFAGKARFLEFADIFLKSLLSKSLNTLLV